jgi:hypothetical protein
MGILEEYEQIKKAGFNGTIDDYLAYIQTYGKEKPSIAPLGAPVGIRKQVAVKIMNGAIAAEINAQIKKGWFVHSIVSEITTYLNSSGAFIVIFEKYE